MYKKNTTEALKIQDETRIILKAKLNFFFSVAFLFVYNFDSNLQNSE